MEKSSNLPSKVFATPKLCEVLNNAGAHLYTALWFTKIIQGVFSSLYYYMNNHCNLIGLEQWYFSLIWNTYMWKLQTFCR